MGDVKNPNNCTYRDGGGPQCENKGIYWVKNVGKYYYPFIPSFIGKSCEIHKLEAEKKKDLLQSTKEVVLIFVPINDVL
jgi:hypothetical protein